MSKLTVYDGYASGYSRWKVLRCARAVAAAVKRIKRDTKETPTIVVHGNSGVSVGFAALVMEEFNLVLLRKDGDNSHGSPVEGPNGHMIDKYYILDDFVSSGDTVRRIVRKLNGMAEAKGHDLPVPMGLIMYHGGRSRVEVDGVWLEPVPLTLEPIDD